MNVAPRMFRTMKVYGKILQKLQLFKACFLFLSDDTFLVAVFVIGN